MASIPLPALNVQPPQVQNPLQGFRDFMAIKSQQQEQQVRAQQLQAGQQEMQQRQQAITDQAARTAAMKEADPSSPTYFEDVAAGVLKHNGSADAAQQEAQRGLGIKKIISDIASTDAATGEKKLKTFIDTHQAMGDALEGLADPKVVPDEQLHQAALGKLDEFTKAGIIPPQAAQQLAASVTSTQDPTQLRTLIDQSAKRMLGAKAVAEQKQAELTAQKTQADTEHQTLENTQLKAYGGLTPGAAEARYLKIQEQKNQGNEISVADAAFAKGYEKNKTLNTQFNFNLQQGGGGAAPLNPRQKSTAQAILDGRMAPPGSFALKTPYWQAVMGEVFNQDPDFSEQRAQLRKDFTVGKHSSEINAINTAMGHVGVLGDAIDALNNSDVKQLNRLANAVGVQTGSDKVTTFNTIVHRVGPEISKAYIGAGGSAGERGTDEKDFDPSLGPQQLKSNVAVTAKLLRSKIGALENQWNQNKGEGMKGFQEQFITPEAKKALDKFNPQGGGGSGSTQQFSHLSASGDYGWDGTKWVKITKTK